MSAIGDYSNRTSNKWWNMVYVHCGIPCWWFSLLFLSIFNEVLQRRSSSMSYLWCNNWTESSYIDTQLNKVLSCIFHMSMSSLHSIIKAFHKQQFDDMSVGLVRIEWDQHDWIIPIVNYCEIKKSRFHLETDLSLWIDLVSIK